MRSSTSSRVRDDDTWKGRRGNGSRRPRFWRGSSLRWSNRRERDQSRASASDQHVPQGRAGPRARERARESSSTARGRKHTPGNDSRGCAARGSDQAGRHRRVERDLSAAPWVAAPGGALAGAAPPPASSLPECSARSEDHAPVILLGHRLWQRRFNGDPAIAGKVVNLSGHAYTVVGVAPPSFRGLDLILDCQFWVPLGTVDQLMPGTSNLTSRSLHWLAVAGRLKGGVTRREAAANLDLLAKRLAQAHPETEKGGGFQFEPAGSLPPRYR